MPKTDTNTLFLQELQKILDTNPEQIESSLFLSFWILRIDMGKFFEHIHQLDPNTQNNYALQNKVLKLKSNSCTKYSELIEKNFLQYLDDMTDSAYDIFSASNGETLDIISEISNNSPLTQNMKNIQETVLAIHKNLKDAEKIISPNANNTAPISIDFFRPFTQTYFKLQDLPQVMNYINAKRFPSDYCPPESLNNFLAAMKKSNALLKKLKENIQCITLNDDKIFNESESTFSPYKNLYPKIMDFIFKLRYLNTASFNLEYILLFLFLNPIPTEATPSHNICNKILKLRSCETVH